ncbi:Chromosome (plasmid) partitioning protein ParB [hydrothermal vent metagenome]|uniref:Chromosome (Plasmid) partitioning protein ParB n=1 Tax=hydrothermal vent metagenome TaxID=652676 RepID=A0A3B0YUR4_9ZZZZ
MARKRGLGRGLDALLGGGAAKKAKEQEAEAREDAVAVIPNKPSKPAVAANDGEMRTISVELIQRGKYQPRTDMHKDSLEELADSIREQGVVQPIVVRPISKDKYEIIAGERRWRASQIAGLQEVPCVVRIVNDRAAIAMALIENIQREDLNPMEESKSLQRLIDEFKMTHQKAAEAVGRSRTGVTNLLRLQELDPRVISLVETGNLEMGHARCLLALKGDIQAQTAQEVYSQGLSVRDTEKLVRKQQEPKEEKKSSAPSEIDPNIKRLQDTLSAKLGADVQIQHTPSGKGKLQIKYNSSDELDGILDRFK